MRMKIDPSNTQVGQDGATLEGCINTLYNVETDPGQETPLNDNTVEKRLAAEIAGHFVLHDAPPELFDHFDLVRPDTALAGT